MIHSRKLLASYLRAALPYKNNFCTELYQKYLLAPRAGHEKLMGSRSRIVSLLSEKKVFPQDGTVTAKMVWEYVNHGLNTVPDYGTRNWPAEADGCIKCEIVRGFKVIAVEICRAIGILARLNPVTGKAEGVCEKNGEICFESMEKEVQKIDEPEKQVTLTLVNKSDRKLEYWLHMTIARFENDVYQTQNYDDLAIEPGEEKELSLAKGAYRIITTQRQIDGGVSCIASSFVMSEDRVFELRQAPAKIAEKCHEAELSDATVQQVTAEGMMVGDPVLMTSLYRGQKSILVFADPGKEPTEHLFQEILECKETQRQGYRVIIAPENTDVLKNETLQRVLHAGLNLVCVTVKNDAYLYQLHESHYVGDGNVFHICAVNTEGKGLCIRKL